MTKGCEGNYHSHTKTRADLGCVQGTASETSWRNSIHLPTLNTFASKMAAYIGGPPLKEQLWLAERVFQNCSLHRGLPVAIKRTILIGCTISHFRGALCLLSEVRNASEADPECKLDKRSSQSYLRVDSEAYPEYHTLRHTLVKGAYSRVIMATIRRCKLYMQPLVTMAISDIWTVWLRNIAISDIYGIVCFHCERSWVPSSTEWNKDLQNWHIVRCSLLALLSYGKYYGGGRLERFYSIHIYIYIIYTYSLITAATLFKSI